MKKFYITTAIDYPNALPHIGTAFEKIGADVQARFRRMDNFDVRFLMGNDENTVKVLKRAEELKRDPKVYVDDMANDFKAIWDALGISYNRFIQTTDADHQKGVVDFILRVQERTPGAFIKKPYSGMYCEGCEEFKIGGICMTHLGQPLKKIEEEHWFFALSKFRGFLADFHKRFPDFIQPESRRAEILNQIDTLEDVCVTRYMDWGIPFPIDPSYKVYVWFDALLNYITGADGYWPPLHVIGKDIVRFHTLLWPAMLQAAQCMQPASVFVHGFVLRDGRKESKSSGNAITPISLIQTYGADAVRYYFMSKCNFHGDGEYTETHIKEVYNGELANNLGNLLSRVVSMIQKYFPSGLPAPVRPATAWIDETWYNRFCMAMGSFNYVSALQNVWELLGEGNNKIEKAAPWTLFKEGKMDVLAGVLREQVALLRIVALCISPVMPTTAEKLYMTFRHDEDQGEEVNYWEAVNKLSFLRLVSRDNGFMFGPVCIRPEALVDGKLPPLFPRK